MQQLETLYLINQLHFQELIQDAELERALRTRPGKHANKSKSNQ